MKANKLLTGLTILTLSAFLLAACGNESNKNDSSSKDSASNNTETSSSKVETVDLNSLDLPQLDSEVKANEALVELQTDAGNIKMKLFPEQAPKAVENFLTHAKNGYYDGVTFHRVMEDFMIQSGDPAGDGTGGESIWNEEFAPEISNQLYHIRGAVAMARTSGDVTAKTQGSQFYIVQNDKDVSDGLLLDDYPEAIIEAYKKGGTPNLDFNYSVFGQVIEGMDVVDKIAKAEKKESAQGETSTPVSPVKINKIVILQEPEE